jgi:hypothetical protein
MSRTLRLPVALLALLVASACSTAPTSPGTTSVQLSGSWHYVASSAASAAVDGTLSLTQGASAAFTGSLSGTETASNGQRVPVSALASGRASDAASIEYDLAFSGIRSRHHVASLRGDTLSGSWYETVDAGSASGTFRAVRSRP